MMGKKKTDQHREEKGNQKQKILGVCFEAMGTKFHDFVSPEHRMEENHAKINPFYRRFSTRLPPKSRKFWPFSLKNPKNYRLFTTS